MHMRVRLLLFAAHRELVGDSRLELDVPENSTAEDVYLIMEGRQPALEPLRPFTTFAVNRQIADPSTVLHPGDEIAFLQPSSGGAA